MYDHRRPRVFGLAPPPRPPVSFLEALEVGKGALPRMPSTSPMAASRRQQPLNWSSIWIVSLVRSALRVVIQRWRSPKAPAGVPDATGGGEGG